MATSVTAIVLPICIILIIITSNNSAALYFVPTNYVMPHGLIA